MATGGGSDDQSPIPRHVRSSVRRSNSVACDQNLRGHRGSFSESDHANRFPRIHEVQEEGEELFESFLSEQIHQEGLEVPERVSSIHTNQDYVDAGSDLRRVADAFRDTQERENVRRQAEQVDVDHITASRFHLLLDGLFCEGNVTRERIVVLFFFCSDVAIRALRQKAIGLFQKLMEWICAYIRDKVCQWVAEHGGWRAVLSGSVHVLRMVVAAVAVCVVGWGLYRYFRPAE